LLILEIQVFSKIVNHSELFNQDSFFIMV